MLPRLALLCLLSAPALAQNAHDHARHLGADVMPFDLARTEHVFRATPDGGTQSVVSRDGDPAQVALIRTHLRDEAARFAAGNYDSPSRIHGAAMPGLATLRAAASQVVVRYEERPDGARITFSSPDAPVVSAVHAWFAAQVRDHGPDVRAER